MIHVENYLKCVACENIWIFKFVSCALHMRYCFTGYDYILVRPSVIATSAAFFPRLLLDRNLSAHMVLTRLQNPLLNSPYFGQAAGTTTYYCTRCKTLINNFSIQYVYHLFLHAPFVVNRKVSSIFEGIGPIRKKCREITVP